MDFWTAAVIIVAITAIASIIRTKHGIRKDALGNELPLYDPDTARMRDEMKALKERVAVLERLATDGNSSAHLDREIEKLRERDRA